MFTADDLTALLDRLALQRARAKTPAEAAAAQVEFLIARIALFTDVLRRAEANEAARLTARMLLSDLAQVAAQFRGSATAMHASLETSLNDLRSVIESRPDGPGRT
jgi:phage-related baseplate assembly protein